MPVLPLMLSIGGLGARGVASWVGVSEEFDRAFDCSSELWDALLSVIVRS